MTDKQGTFQTNIRPQDTDMNTNKEILHIKHQKDIHWTETSNLQTPKHKNQCVKWANTIQITYTLWWSNVQFPSNPKIENIKTSASGTSVLKMIIYKLVQYNNSGHNSPLRARDCQLNAGLKFTCLQTEVNDHPASLVWH